MPRKQRRRAHGQGSVYQRGPGNFWIKWREGGRVRYAHGYETHDEALAILRKIISDVNAGKAGLPPDPKDAPTLEHLAKDWLKRRKETHRATKGDRSRWRTHLGPFFGKMRPAEVNAAAIRRFVEQKLPKLNSSTVRHCVRLLSTFLSDLVERGYVRENPVHTLPRSTRRLLRSTTDPRDTPFLEKLDDVRCVFQVLPFPCNVAFAIGALAGLRTGEIIGLEWRDIDLESSRINIRRRVYDSKVGPLKDDESRIAPVQGALVPILKTYKLRVGGEGKLFPPCHPKRGGRPGATAKYMRPATLWAHLKTALDACKIRKIPAPTKEDSQATRYLSWYQCTRHTFASQWVMAGGSIEKLAKVMGHSSVVVTERYAHLRVDLFSKADYTLLDLDLTREPGKVITMLSGNTAAGTNGYTGATQAPGRQVAR